jgi:hypothetical protein
MSGQAQISSIEAIAAFRADLIVYLSQMQPVLDEVGGEVVRMRFWLQNEGREFWENQLRRRRRKLEEAQAELFNAKLSTLQDSSILQHMQAQKARRAVEEAEQKLAALKKWERELENLTEPLLKQVSQLQGFLSADLARGVAALTQTVQALEAYRQVASPSVTAPPAPATETNKASS